ncbi:DUF3179 domain-containing (seleno)protein [Rhodonellum sp.]|uniref:DUF3179 domain-containing (seleno)protein n=1 Tax=Rhodonellum sp. TaxID=2231180 RepID=UPI0027156BFC|nr:DUF3179 domain-containing (seleno)protein [Rhodonellum sp.]MDO9552395.1 DUF3179 domain-containing (seleno)protein [Rhodonellum sp.]
MKKLFFIGLIGLGYFEILKIYFIMPMPGSQQWAFLEFAYFLHSYRWVLRAFFLGLILLGSKNAFSTSPNWVPVLGIAAVLAICLFFNYKMIAERMFLEPKNLSFSTGNSAALADSSLVIVVEHAGEAKAYPIRYIAYHHQVRDVLGGKEIMVTYCSVCRTGRVFEPMVKGQPESFRLVGMDHFNAMFEDQTTGTWWQQANGEGIIGPLKGETLPELESSQLTLGKFLSLYPNGKVMDPDPDFLHKYDSLGKYEFGLIKSKLTGTDILSWKEKSWIVGISINGQAKAYDWNLLKTNKIIHDQMDILPVLLILSQDGQSFAAFKRTHKDQVFHLKNDTLFTDQATFDFTGKSLNHNSKDLEKLPAYQEFWHSWRTFHPFTETHNLIEPLL